ncbi:hemolysin D [Fibrobacterales bacterium]|nr:hemolysin D [Fibrobacterales bacterium]
MKVIIALAILAIVGGGIYFYKMKNSKQDLKLETAFVSLGDIVQTVTATGRLQPIDQVDVGTEVSGTVSKIYADFNQLVKNGQVLLEIDPQKAKARLDQVRASYKSSQNEEIYQRKNYVRTLSLFQKGGATAVELENADYKYKNAQSSLIIAKSNLETAELDLQNCIIKSPIDGIVLSRAVEQGQTVAASLSAPTLFTLARDLRNMEVKADVDEADIGSVKVGQRVEFSVDAFSGENFTGEVQEVRLSPTISSNVVTYTVIIRADNPNQKLLPGMTANCNIIVEEVLQVPTVPARALQFKPDESTPGYSPQLNEPPNAEGRASAEKGIEKGFSVKSKKQNRGSVWILGSNGFLYKQRVVIGSSDGTKTQILEGVEVNQSVAVGVSAITEETAKNTAVNPFMPQRKNNQSGGNRPPRM